MKQIVLQIAIILAFVVNGISPACAFVGGKGMLEICASDGTIQTIEVPEEYLPFMPDQPKPEKVQKDDCPFCFASVNVPALSEETALLETSFSSYRARVIRHDGFFFSLHPFLKPPRGPPYS